MINMILVIVNSYTSSGLDKGPIEIANKGQACLQTKRDLFKAQIGLGPSLR